MKILVITITYNRADIIPYFLRHYLSFADEIWAFDDQSTDNTQAYLGSNRVVLQDWPYPGSGIDEDLFLQFAYATYPKAVGKFDWVIWADPDELVYAPDICLILHNALKSGHEVIPTTGFNMMGDGLPKRDNGHQLWQTMPMGVYAPVYSKPIVFRPEVKIRWIRGKHALDGCNPKMMPRSPLKLLHYKYLGSEYTRQRNAQNYARCGLADGDKSAAWTCKLDYDGADKDHEGSPGWADWAKQFQFNVLEKSLNDYHGAS